ncbi:hypothetical protein CK203_010246 [Vitis vinifera]|uniref:Uncharacterized protein n=1 Tax=Vitis vinifera TaxID=29760 RepID=A0A438JXU0_VITVI|nr:hypothetical protein CK203_010246 [Vitis vinifera]
MGIASLFILIQSPNGKKEGILLGFLGFLGLLSFYNSSATKRMVVSEVPLSVLVEFELPLYRDEERKNSKKLEEKMGEALLTTLSMENHPCTLLSMDSGAFAHDDLEREMNRQVILSGPPDINLPLSAEPSPPPQLWNDSCDILDVGLGPQVYETEAITNLPKVGRKCSKRLDSIWGAWFFFSFYFKPVFNEKSKSKITRDCNGISGYDKSDLEHEVFLVQHDMENMYMWVFKERPENALGKMQLRSYMNGHSRLGERPFPFSVDKGFVRSHRMQRKHYRDRKRWKELTGRDINFSIPLEASDFSSWRNLPNTEFELERAPPLLKNHTNPHPRKLLNGTSLNLSTQPSNHVNGDVLDLSPVCNKRRKDFFPHGNDDDCCLPNNAMEIHPIEPHWSKEFSGVMRNVYGPVTAAKTIYEDDEGFLIIISLPFADLERVKVTWRNTPSHGIVKISCVREIPLPTRIPEDAKLEAYRDETGTMLEIVVPKQRVGPEEHEVRVCLRPLLGVKEHMLT